MWTQEHAPNREGWYAILYIPPSIDEAVESHISGSAYFDGEKWIKEYIGNKYIGEVIDCFNGPFESEDLAYEWAIDNDDT